MTGIIKKIIIIINILFIVFFFEQRLRADIVILIDGTVIVGKVINEDKERIYLKNSYKVFDINRNQIKSSFITSQYQEDVEIHKRLGLKADEIIIKKNYLAGLEKGEITPEAGWNGRGSFLACYYVTTGRLKEIIPYSFGAALSYEQALYNIKIFDFATKGQNERWFPYLRSEIEYCRYEKGEAQLDKVNLSAGPEWFLPFIKNNWGSFVISALPGISYLKAAKYEKEASGVTFTLCSIAGYETVIKGSTFFIQCRYLYITDKVVNLSGIGLGIGTSYKIW